MKLFRQKKKNKNPDEVNKIIANLIIEDDEGVLLTDKELRRLGAEISTDSAAIDRAIELVKDAEIKNEKGSSSSRKS